MNRIIIVCNKCEVESEPVTYTTILPIGWIGLDQNVTEETDRDDGDTYDLHFCGADCLLAWLNKGLNRA
jgi:hypothetical protein